MAMHKLDDLSEIGKTIFNELKKLGFESIRNTEMVINNDKRETVISYHNSAYGKQEVIEINYKENPVVRKWANDLRKREDAFVPVYIAAKEIKKWDQYRKQLGYKPDPGMAKAKAVYYYSYSIGLGAISVSTWQTLDEDQVKILARFRNVFKLSYQRYSDIASAEAQTREAKIETALERVRTVAMGMHKQDDLMEICKVVYVELQALGFSELRNTLIDTFVDEEKYFIDYDYSEFSGGTSSKIPYSGNPVVEKHIKNIRKSGEAFLRNYSKRRAT